GAPSLRRQPAQSATKLDWRWLNEGVLWRKPWQKDQQTRCPDKTQSDCWRLVTAESRPDLTHLGRASQHPALPTNPGGTQYSRRRASMKLSLRLGLSPFPQIAFENATIG